MSLPEERVKRLEEILAYLDDFKFRMKGDGNDIVYQNKAAEIIIALYYRYADEVIRETITSGIIKNYKIAANTELAIMLADPLVNDDDKTKRKFTALLAFYCAERIMIEWNDLDEKKCSLVIESDQEIKDFIEEHINWLYLLDPIYYYPVFSNSQVWRLYFYLLRDRTKVI